jgi:hypothetical protein
MLYSILIYGFEERVAAWTAQEEQDVFGRHASLRQDLKADRRLGPVLRLQPNQAKTLRKYRDRRFITDGPFAETKEQLMGIYVFDCATYEDAIAAAERLAFEGGVFEIRPVTWLDPGDIPAHTPALQKIAM